VKTSVTLRVKALAFAPNGSFRALMTFASKPTPQKISVL